MSRLLQRSFAGKLFGFLAVSMLLLIGFHGSIAEAQSGSSFGYVLVTGSSWGFREGGGRWYLDVDRLLIGKSYDSKSFKVCFTGSATPGVDFTVDGISLTGNCFTDSWNVGPEWYIGAKKRYVVRAQRDNARDPNETIIATVAEHGDWGGAYTIVVASARTTIRGG